MIAAEGIPEGLPLAETQRGRDGRCEPGGAYLMIIYRETSPLPVPMSRAGARLCPLQTTLPSPPQSYLDRSAQR